MAAPSTLRPGDSLILQLLERAPFTRRRGGGWRFGAKTISSPVVERLIASRQARIEGDRLVRIAEPLTAWCWSPDPADEGWLIEYTAGGASDCHLLIHDPHFAACRRSRYRFQRICREAAE